jgi:hypothetical protein
MTVRAAALELDDAATYPAGLDLNAQQLRTVVGNEIVTLIFAKGL